MRDGTCGDSNGSSGGGVGHVVAHGGLGARRVGGGGAQMTSGDLSILVIGRKFSSGMMLVGSSELSDRG